MALHDQSFPLIIWGVQSGSEGGWGGRAADIFCSDRNYSKSIADIYTKISGDLKNNMKLHSANFQATVYNSHIMVTRFLRKLQFLAKIFR